MNQKVDKLLGSSADKQQWVRMRRVNIIYGENPKFNWVMCWIDYCQSYKPRVSNSYVIIHFNLYFRNPAVWWYTESFFNSHQVVKLLQKYWSFRNGWEIAEKIAGGVSLTFLWKYLRNTLIINCYFISRLPIYCKKKLSFRNRWEIAEMLQV